MVVWCRAAHRRFWVVEERFVDTLGIIEYWVCSLCHRRWTLSLPPAKDPSRPHKLTAS
jgi:hypothetical protein